MGNCSQKSSSSSSSSSSVAAKYKAQNFIQVMTDSGRVMELQGPKLAREVLDDFPGYGVYQRGHLSLPLFEDELLCNGQVYYLLPFGMSSNSSNRVVSTTPFSGSLRFRRDQNAVFEVLPTRGNGVWRVKMAISSKELKEMLAENNAEGLIQMMRAAAMSSETPPARGFGWRSTAVSVISSGLRFPAPSRRLTAC